MEVRGLKKNKMPYPNPDLNNPLDLIKYANIVSEGWAINLFLLALGVVVFVLTKNQNYKISSCFLMTTTSCFFFSVLFWVSGLLLGKIVVLLLAMDLLCVIWVKLED